MGTRPRIISGPPAASACEPIKIRMSKNLVNALAAKSPLSDKLPTIPSPCLEDSGFSMSVQTLATCKEIPELSVDLEIATLVL